MTASPADPTTAAATPTEEWLRVCDDLLWAFNHALSNRLAALTSITRILEYSDTGLDPLLSALSTELGSLERTLELLRLLPRNSNLAPEPVRLEDLLPEVLTLHRLQSEMRDLEYAVEAEPDTTPIWVEPSLLTHTLLLVLSAASRAACGSGASTVTIRYGGDEQRVRVAIESPATGEIPDPVPRALGTWRPLHASVLRSILRPMGAELIDAVCGDDPSNGVRFEFQLPTLLSARAAERDGPG